jgi:transketolase
VRNAFAQEITALAAAAPELVLLSGDIGNRLFNDFKAQFADRFYNCGVAEANMTSVAAGMAMTGLRPFTYTIVPFVTTRCLEQIRVDVCYHHQPVTIVGVGGGLSYASLGATHHSCEDIAMLRVLPEMSVLCPADAFEVRACVRAALAHNGPVYIRLGKKNEPLLHDRVPDLTLGRWLPLRDGPDIALLGTGNMLPTVLEAADALADDGVSAAVYSCASVKPLDTDVLAQVFDRCPVVATVEEHSVLGGFGSAVAEWCATARPAAAPLIFGSADRFLHGGTSVEHAREQYGLTAAAIARRCRDAVEQAG